jgi:hypothetical protein
VVVQADGGTSNAVPFVYSGSFTTRTFEYAGMAQTWTVPAGVTQATFDLYGAAGGSQVPPVGTKGGLGGRVMATLTVTPGEVVTIMVGGQGGDNYDGCQSAGAGGFNGGAAGGPVVGSSFPCPSAGAGGGGASDVRIGGAALANRVLVAGGGGGAADFAIVGSGPGLCRAAGGAGGGLTGGSGGCAGGGAGGNQTGSSGSGQLGQGSAGAEDTRQPVAERESGGGGGGGYYGGGGGAARGGGGGGSAFVGAGARQSNVQSGVRSGHGLITVTFNPPGGGTPPPVPGR